MKVWNGKTRHRYAHVKRDGHMISVNKDEFGNIKYLTKSYNAVDLRFLKDTHAILLERVPYETRLLCELWKPGERASYISSGIAKRDSEMALEVFAVEKGLPPELSLGDTKLEVGRWGLQFIPFYDKADHPLAVGAWDCVESLPIIEQPGHCEGYVLKDSNCSEFFKYKPFKSCDLVVVGVKPGVGKFSGLIGSLECALSDGTIVANVSGMDDAMRKQLTMMHDVSMLCGTIVEVSYQYVGSQGRLRHPSFVRIRDDKSTPDERP